MAASRSVTVQREHVVFPQQQWLHDFATLLRRSYVAYLDWCVDSEEVMLDVLMSVM
jgi:hypothetical protein